MMNIAIRGSVFLLCLVPFVLIVVAITSGTAGPDPAEFIMNATGEWAARILLLCLLASPLRKWMGWTVVLKLRRMLGLYAFFYASVHLATFGHFFVGWSVPILTEELLERPYITMGFAAWVFMLPMAFTSTRAMQRRLRRNWQRLHRLVYPAAVFVCLHILWQARSDIGEALVYIGLFSWMLIWRYFRHQRAS